MEQKEYLSEATYQKNKRKLSILAVVLLLVGLVIGGGLITFGAIKMGEVDREYAAKQEQIEESKKSEQTETQGGRTIEQIKADIDEVQAQVNVLEAEISDLSRRQNQAFMDGGFDDVYYDFEAQIDAKQQELSRQRSLLSKYNAELLADHFDTMQTVGLEGSEFQQNYDKTKLDMEKSKYIPFFMFGGFIILAFGIIALSIFMFAKRREMLAFQVQQVMPVAQEGITKMAPTVGKAMGTMAKEATKTMTEVAPEIGKAAGEIAKGIKNGLRDE